MKNNNGWQEGVITRITKGMQCEGIVVECNGKTYSWGSQQTGEWNTGDKVKIMFWQGRVSYDAGVEKI